MPNMNHYYQTIGENWFTYPNLYGSMVSSAKNGAHFVEVGSWKGRSACFMGVEILNSGKKIRLDCVDTWLGSEEHCIPELETDKDFLYNIFLKNIEPLKTIIKPIRMESRDAARLYNDSSLDFVFLDASHDYTNVLHDIAYWLPKVKPSGTIAGHDWPHEPIRRAVLDMFGEIFIDVNEDCWIVKKV